MIWLTYKDEIYPLKINIEPDTKWKYTLQEEDNN